MSLLRHTLIECETKGNDKVMLMGSSFLKCRSIGRGDVVDKYPTSTLMVSTFLN